MLIDISAAGRWRLHWPAVLDSQMKWEQIAQAFPPEVAPIPAVISGALVTAEKMLSRNDLTGAVISAPANNTQTNEGAIPSAVSEDTSGPLSDNLAQGVTTRTRSSFDAAQISQTNTHEPATMQIRCVSGWQVGWERLLPCGHFTLGSSPQADIHFSSPGLSRAHVRIQVSPGRVQVEALSQVNPVWVEGKLLPIRKRTEWKAGTVLQCGRHSLRAELTPTASQHQETDFLQLGKKILSESGSGSGTKQSLQITWPEETAAENFKLSWPWQALVPLPLIGLAAWLFGQPMMLVFMLLTPVMLAVSWFEQARRTKQEQRKARTTYEQSLSRAHTELDTAFSADRHNHALPGPEELLHQLPPEDPRKDGFLLSLGWGIVPGGVQVSQNNSVYSLPTPEKTVVVRLAAGKVMQVHLPDQRCLPWVHLLVAQVRSRTLAADFPLLFWDPRHSPGKPWQSLRTDLAGIPGIEFFAGSAIPADRGGLLVVWGLNNPVPWSGVTIVFSSSNLPNGSIQLTAQTDGQYELSSPQGRQLFIPDLPHHSWWVRWVRQFLRHLTPAAEGIPSYCAAAELIAVLPRSARKIRAWQANANTTPPQQNIATGFPVIIGRDASGPYVFDLPKNGPHALIGGTTGAGKSALLRTYLGAIIQSYTPDEISIILVDFKGGTSFSELSQSPHTMTLVSDLDERDAERLLSSLLAEVHLREELFVHWGCTDFSSYTHQQAQYAQMPVLPRLLTVIDEFQTLTSRLPNFIAGIVRLASVGRSLGIHIVLSTQRPAGAITPDMRANIRARIALRMEDVQESQDVIGSPLAATISVHTPGRAIVRTDSGPGHEVQVANPESPILEASLWAEPVNEQARAQVAAHTHPGGLEHQSVSWLQQVIDDANQKCSPHKRKILLPRLQVPLTGDIPPARASLQIAHSHEKPGFPTKNLADIGEVPACALLDRPDWQAHVPLTYRPDTDGNLLLFGGSRSGKSMAATSVLQSVSAASVPLVFSNDSLLRQWAIEKQGHCYSADLSGLTLFLAMLMRPPLPEKNPVVAAHSLEPPAVESQNQTNRGFPARLIIIDSWEDFCAAAEEYDHGICITTFTEWVRTNTPSSSAAIITGGRPLVLAKVATLLNTRLAFRPADRADYGLLEIPRARIPYFLPPGVALSVTGEEIVFYDPRQYKSPSEVWQA